MVVRRIKIWKRRKYIWGDARKWHLVANHINDTSRPLETGVPQRDFRVWLHPKRRLACPLRRLPMKPNGPRQRRRIECLEEAQFYAAA